MERINKKKKQKFLRIVQKLSRYQRKIIEFWRLFYLQDLFLFCYFKDYGISCNNCDELISSLHSSSTLPNNRYSILLNASIARFIILKSKKSEKKTIA